MFVNEDSLLVSVGMFGRLRAKQGSRKDLFILFDLKTKLSIPNFSIIADTEVHIRSIQSNLC